MIKFNRQIVSRRSVYLSSPNNLDTQIGLQVFSMDIHPQAKFGKGILMDHGTGIVVGQTAVVGNNVSILQNVTLGGECPRPLPCHFVPPASRADPSLVSIHTMSYTPGERILMSRTACWSSPLRRLWSSS